MAGSDDLWAWLQSLGGNWANPSGGADPTGGSPTGGAPFQLPGATPSSPAGTILSRDRYGNPIGIGAYPDSTNYARTPPAFNWPDSSTPTGMPTPPGSPSATPRPADAAPAGPLASLGATAAPPMKRRAGAANLGYYQPNDRFVPIDRPNAPAEGGGQARGGPPKMSALNLAGLFNRGQQPGVNPNAPAANAQPVSAATPGGQIASAGPTPYGPDTPRLNPSGLLALLGGNQPPNGYGSVPVPYPPQRPLGY
jgi:hypothetical protein